MFLSEDKNKSILLGTCQTNLYDGTFFEKRLNGLIFLEKCNHRFLKES